MRHLWLYWLNEPIFLDSGVLNILKRKEVLYIFCKEGLLPFVERAGYRFHFDEKTLYKTLLNVTFALFCKKKVLGYEVENEFVHEQYNEYCYRLDSSQWEQFWEEWGMLQDFQEGHFAYSLRHSLSELVWSWIDLESSPTAIKLHRELEAEEEYEEATKGKEDPYLVETSKRDYQDRHW